MARNYTKVLLITANVGSIFEDPERMLDLWMNEFLTTIKRIDPDFLVVHCQEVGGKNYEESMQHVNQFVKRLLGSAEMQQFDKARVFLDEDFTAVDKFTALGSLYFIHQSLQHVQLFDFQEKKFVPVKGREVLSGNIESVAIKEKAKFPQEFFPDFKWSRKGFMRTRWNICNSIFDLVNIHLFHDASNITAMETSPSTYSRNRRNALRHTIERFETDEYGVKPFFIFGDFNFRLDTRDLIERLTEKTNERRTKGKKNDVSKIVYTATDNGKTILTVEKKGFDHHDYHNEVFSNNNNKWLQEYDREPKDFSDKMYEYEVTFPPSYPFSEDIQDGTSYMKTRCPAWCDRIMCSYDVHELIYQDDSPIEYNMIGPNICMGDHKPIYLSFKLRHNTGKDNVSECDGVDSGDIDLHPPLAKVISINGEQVDTSDMEHVNIHDYATFEQEEFIRNNNFRRRTYPQKDFANEGLWPVKKQLSFHDVAHDVLRAQNVLLALRHYHHRSDSEDESNDDDEENQQRELTDNQREPSDMPKNKNSIKRNSSLKNGKGDNSIVNVQTKDTSSTSKDMCCTPKDSCRDPSVNNNLSSNKKDNDPSASGGESSKPDPLHAGVDCNVNMVGYNGSFKKEETSSETQKKCCCNVS